jgi:hypothetical protein
VREYGHLILLQDFGSRAFLEPKRPLKRAGRSLPVSQRRVNGGFLDDGDRPVSVEIGLSGINFEFYPLNHQFPDDFKF